MTNELLPTQMVVPNISLRKLIRAFREAEDKSQKKGE
jgi:hypothetical protein